MFKNRADADRFLAAQGAAEARLKESRKQRHTAYLSVGAVVDDYYRRRKRRLQLSTQHHYEQVIRKHIEPKIGSLNAREVSENPGPLQDFYDTLPPTTAVHVHQILRPAFQYAVDHKRIQRNPCAIAKPPRKKRREKLIPSADEVAKIVIGARESDETFGLFVWIVSKLGLRRGEACALRWEDFDFVRNEVRIVRTIARKKGGTYIKPPKSGESRTLRLDPRFFERLQSFRKSTGWLFPRAYNTPYVGSDGLAPHATAGRLLATLNATGGTLRSAEGRAGIEAAGLVSLGTYSAGPMLHRLERDGYIERVGNRSRTYEIRLTELGRDTIAAWSVKSDDGLPWFPTTADAKFRDVAASLDLPYTLHSLRHFVATHLYNRSRDWVQLARFLGHTSPAITMNLYANHVIDASQLALGESAMELYDDPDV